MAAGTDGGSAFAGDVSRPPVSSGDGNGTPLLAGPDANASSPVLPAGDAAGAASAPAGSAGGSDSGGGSGGSGGPLDNRHGHGHRPSKNGDPLWVLDLYDRIVLADASTTFANWNMTLDAQVSGANVQSYTWTLTGIDFASHGSLKSYNLQFQWGNPASGSGSDTVSLTTTNVGGGGETQTFHFNVLATSTPAYQSPIAAATFPLLVLPDAVKPDQAMIDQPYNGLGEETGEVRTRFALPTYNPGIAPLQLDYSSAAANPEPIFTEYYQLSLPITSTSTVTATLKLNGVTQQTASYDTHLRHQERGEPLGLVRGEALSGVIRALPWRRCRKVDHERGGDLLATAGNDG